MKMTCLSPINSIQNTVFYTLLFLFITLTSPLQAQYGYPDAVYLNNGSILKCRIVDYQEGKELKIEIQGGSVLVYKMEEVKEIVRGNAGSKEEQIPENSKTAHWYRKNQREFHLFQKGNFFFSTNMNIMGGFKERTNSWSGDIITVPTLGAGFDFSFGKVINRHLMVGAGVGWAMMDNYFMNSSHIPVYAEIRGDINNRPTSLYYSFGIGYNTALMQRAISWRGMTMQDAKGGIYVNPAIGLRFKSRDKMHFTIEFNYSIHTASYTYLGPNSEIIGPTKNIFSRPTLALGFLF